MVSVGSHPRTVLADAQRVGSAQSVPEVWVSGDEPRLSPNFIYGAQVESSSEDSSSRATGVWTGLGVGVAIWVAYFVLASVNTEVFWDVFVVPIVAATFVASLGVAYSSSSRRKWWIGFAIGMILVLPISLAIILMVFSALNLE